MISILAVVLIIFLAVVSLVAAIVLRKLAAPNRSLPVTAEWIDDLSVDRYRPMMRLLDRRDVDFLRSQAGFTPKMEARLRAQRCQIFRDYLRCLEADFGRVCMALKMILLHSELDRPDLSAVLVRHQIMFASGIWAAHFQVCLYSWGIGTVDVTRLVGIFDVLRIELRNLVPLEMGAGA